MPAAVGLLFQPGVWYRDHEKPTWTPPDKLFPVIWAVLRVLMSLVVARMAEQPDSALALGLWSVQITISTLWSAVFFGLHRIGTGAAIIAVLWAAVLATMLVFLRHDAAAALIMLPYLASGSFVLALNVSETRRNSSMDAA